MTDVRLFDVIPEQGIRQYFVYDHETDAFQIVTEQDTESIQQQALDERNKFDERAGWKGDVHHVASIPAPLWQEMQRQGITHDEEAIRKWLNDPENRCFRTRPGRV